MHFFLNALRALAPRKEIRIGFPMELVGYLRVSNRLDTANGTTYATLPGLAGGLTRMMVFDGDESDHRLPQVVHPGVCHPEENKPLGFEFHMPQTLTPHWGSYLSMYNVFIRKVG